MVEGSARVLIFDAALIGLFVVMAVQVVVAARRRHSGGASPEPLDGAVAAAGIVVILVLHGSDLLEVFSAGRHARYPSQPGWVLVAVFVATIGASLLLFDGALRWAQWLENRLRGGDAAHRRSSAIVQAGGLLGALVFLSVVALPPAVAIAAPTTTTTTTTTTAPPTTTTTTLPVLIELSGTGPAPGDVPLALERITESGDLEFPTGMVPVPGTGSFLVIERAGRVRLLGPDGVRPDPYLDLSAEVWAEADSGLLGIALHPDFTTNRRFFLYYRSVAGPGVVAEFVAGSSLDDPPHAVGTILEIPQLKAAHQGGALRFGPDGLLYVGVGDGGEPSMVRTPTVLRGAILRIDVDSGDPYAIPEANLIDPEVGPTEVWVYGLRNPYQFWFDTARRLAFIGDVGFSIAEEIDVAPLDSAGLDFGWITAEGFGCLDLMDHTVQFGGCDRSGFTDPIIAYGHDTTCAVVAGPVYRGSAIPVLQGRVLFADYCRRWIRAFTYEDGAVTGIWEWIPPTGSPVGAYTAFAVDEAGEVYLVTVDGGVVYRLVAGAAG